ncbi:hypothetical protein [Streptomyces lasiicapitis]|uniref:Uncharacterized protein n=1 Tax=Streptomyces lasiicapitis TaxID=1923961 RepID=A0ABQ2MJE3_9ACTN|nr:hypothetical protein [Streptomyces lasiicapitis]GGO53682.1 hypothetical protein GCM10012286_61650 [Streptomyces lasiicapitis]
MDRSAGPFWPGSARSALLAVPVVLIGLLILLGVMRASMDWPSERNEGKILIGIFLLAILPVLLVLFGSLADGGEVEAFGIRVQFPAAERQAREIAVSPRMGLAPGVPLNDSSTAAILDTLQEAARSDVAVVDLEDGRAWWETRLLVLCAGAVRLERPKAIVFLATVGDSGAGTFQGWATPAALLDRLLSRPALRRSYERALAVSRQWDQAIAGTEGGIPTLPFASPAAIGYAHFFFPGPGGERNPFASEQVLAVEVGNLESRREHGVLTTTRLKELFQPVLRREAAVVDARPNSPESWQQKTLDTDEQFIPLVHKRGCYECLLSREQALNEILRALTTVETN